MNRTITIFLSLTILLLAICLSGCNLSSARQVSEEPVDRNDKPVQFLNDYAKAQQIAFDENKPLLVYFMANDCVFSRQMTRDTFADPLFIKYADNFVCVQIDVNEKKAATLCEEFKIKGTPTIQFLSPSGIMLQRLTQPQPAKELVLQMQAVLYSIAWNDVREYR